jgi:hypothetical protein
VIAAEIVEELDPLEQMQSIAEDLRTKAENSGNV